MTAANRESILADLLEEGRTEYPKFLDEQLAADNNIIDDSETPVEAPKKKLDNAQPLTSGAVQSELAEHQDTVEPAKSAEAAAKDDTELKQELGEKYKEFIQKVEEFNRLKVERAGHQSRLKEIEQAEKKYHESLRSLGAFTRSDGRTLDNAGKEKVVLNDELDGLKKLRSEIIAEFDQITDPEIRKSIYEYFKKQSNDPYDDLGLSDVILHRKTVEFASRALKNKTELSFEPKDVESDKMIAGIEVEEGLEVKPKSEQEVSVGQVKAMLKPATEADPAPVAHETAVSEVPITATPEAKPEPEIEAKAEIPVSPRNPIDLASFGPDGNQTASQETTTGNFKEDPIDQSINVNARPLEVKTGPAQASEQGVKNLGNISDIKERMGLTPTVSTERPPIKLFEPQVNNASTEAPKAAGPAQPENTAQAGAEIAMQPAKITNENQVVDNFSTQPNVQHFTAEQAEKKGGLFGWFRRGNKTAEQTTTAQAQPLDRIGSVNHISGKGEELDTSHIADIEQNLSQDSSKGATE